VWVGPAIQNGGCLKPRFGVPLSNLELIVLHGDEIMKGLRLKAQGPHDPHRAARRSNLSLAAKSRARIEYKRAQNDNTVKNDDTKVRDARSDVEMISKGKREQ